MTEIQGKSILVRVSARFKLSGVNCNCLQNNDHGRLADQLFAEAELATEKSRNFVQPRPIIVN